MTHLAHPASGLRFASRVAVFFGVALICVLPAQAQTFTVLHAFSGPDGSFPSGGVTIAGSGNLYGVTPYGGTYYNGLAYEMKLIGAGWVFTPLYQFRGQGDGISPIGDLTFGPDGALYGTAILGGAGAGTVFSLKPQPTICNSTRCPWLESTIWPFEGLQGEQPAYGALVFDRQGNAYGTTLYGGDNGDGVVYQLSRRGQVWTETRLYNFGSSPSDGVMPFHNVVLDRAGNLYGTTYLGGAYGGGTVFQLVPSGGSWTENIIANFPAGAELQAGLIIDATGNLYGATLGVGTDSQVFELSSSGNTWQLNILHTFVTTMSNLGPMGNLAMDHTGNLYGTTYSLGLHGRGNIFELTPSGNGWTYTDLCDFTGQNDGAGPMGDLNIDANGTIYGTAQSGGNGMGVVWELTP